MFGSLKNIVDLVRDGIRGFRQFKSAKERRQTILDMLKTYFLLNDCVDEGEALIQESGPDPVATIQSMDDWRARTTLERWDGIILRQYSRLRMLEGYFVGQHHLTVINPSLQQRIEKVIGYKGHRVITLHRIGAALFFRFAMPVANTNEERAGYAAIVSGQGGKRINLKAARAEIKALRGALDQYRTVVERFVSDEELLKLSKLARRSTMLKETPKKRSSRQQS